MNLQDQYLLAKHLQDALNKANERILKLEEKIKKLEEQKNNSKNEQVLFFRD